jgi:hypothetical protein
MPSYVQTDQQNALIRAVVISTGSVTTLAGQPGVSAPFSDGIGAAATFTDPTGIAINAAGTFALVVSVAISSKPAHYVHICSRVPCVSG